MAAPVFIHLPMDEKGRLTWTGVGLSNGALCRQEPLQVLAKALSGERIVAVVPGVDVLITRVQSPKTSRSNLEKAVPFLLEEQLADSVEELHFSLGKRGVNGQLSVIVIARKLLSHWMETIKNVGIRPEAVVCEPLLLPWQPGRWTLLITSEKAIVRTGLESGFALDSNNLLSTLTLLMNDENEKKPQSLNVLDFTRGINQVDLSGLGIPILTEERDDNPLSLFAANYAQNPSINLLQGVFSPSSQLRGWWQPFKMTAWLMIGWFLFRSGYGLYMENQNEKQMLVLNQRIESHFREAFPNVRRVVDARVQMNQGLKSLRGSDQPTSQKGFLSLITRSGEVLKTVPGVTLKSMRFQEGKLDFFMRLKDLQTLDRVKQKLEKKQLIATIQNANKDKEGVEGHLRIISK